MLNCLLFFYLLFYFPFLLRKKRGLLQKLFTPPPIVKGEHTIWIHAVSVGEVKAAKPFFFALQKEEKNAFFLITTTTLTGLEEAKRSLSGASCYQLLPFDFSFQMRKWVRQLKVKTLYLIEGDIWPNLLTEIKKGGGKTILVSAKMSERSFRRFSFFPRLSKKLFSKLDLILVQNQQHYTRFLPFVTDLFRLQITGNLKWALQKEIVPLPGWLDHTTFPKQTVAITCTHSPEEEWLLDQLISLPYFFILAPRHPDRCDLVAAILRKKKISFVRWSENRNPCIQDNERVLLVDAIGQLSHMYALSQLAIVGGSYTDTVGGHNILEPSLYSIPVFFGPHMFNQQEITDFLLKEKLGKQVELKDLGSEVFSFFNAPFQISSISTNPLKVVQQTIETIHRFMPH